MVTFSRAFCRSSSSFSVSATWRRRFWTTSACALPAMRLALVLRHALDALVGAPLAGEVGLHEQIDDGADRHRRQQQQADAAGDRCYPRASPMGLPRASCTSAAASACARRGVSP